MTSDPFVDLMAAAAKKEQNGPIRTDQVTEEQMLNFFESHPEIISFATEHTIRIKRADAGMVAPSPEAKQSAHIMALCMSLAQFGVWLEEQTK